MVYLFLAIVVFIIIIIFCSIVENKTDDIDIDDRDRYGDVSR